MDRETIEKICELQSEIDGYKRFLRDFMVSIIHREHRYFVVHHETTMSNVIDTIWDEYDKLLDEAKLAQDLQEKQA